MLQLPGRLRESQGQGFSGLNNSSLGDKLSSWRVLHPITWNGTPRAVLQRPCLFVFTEDSVICLLTHPITKVSITLWRTVSCLLPHAPITEVSTHSLAHSICSVDGCFNLSIIFLTFIRHFNFIHYYIEHETVYTFHIWEMMTGFLSCINQAII